MSSMGEFEEARAYYRQTIRKHLGSTPLTGAAFAVASHAWQRLDRAHRAWVSETWLSETNWPKGPDRAAGEEVREFEPRRLEKDSTIQPEVLAGVASARLGTPKPKSIRSAAEEAHRILIGCRDYLASLPEPKQHPAALLDDYFGTVSFREILDVSNPFPLLPTVQEGRNEGRLTLRALEQALKRYVTRVPKGLRKRIGNQIQNALKRKEISCRLLEEVRWDRFHRRYKS